MQIDASSIQATGLPARAAPEPSHVRQPDSGQPAPPADEEALHNAVRAANVLTRSLPNKLEFSLDRDSGRTVVRIYDADSRELIRQPPSEEMLAIARALDKLQGMLIRDQA